MVRKFLSSLFLPLWGFLHRLIPQTCEEFSEAGMTNIYLWWLKNIILQIWSSTCNTRWISYSWPCSLLKVDTAGGRCDDSAPPGRCDWNLWSPWVSHLETVFMLPTLWDAPALFKIPEILKIAQAIRLIITKSWCLKFGASL